MVQLRSMLVLQRRRAWKATGFKRREVLIGSPISDYITLKHLFLINLGY